MNDEQLIRNLRRVGMEVFEIFYAQFADESLTNQEVAASLKAERPHYTDNSCRTRVGNARMIIRADRGGDALKLCTRISKSLTHPIVGHTL